PRGRRGAGVGAKAREGARRQPQGGQMSGRGWPDGDDPVAAELRRALDEAQQRVPDDMTLRRGWAAIDNGPTPKRRGARLSWFAGGMASTAALALACAAWLWPRGMNPERPQA